MFFFYDTATTDNYPSSYTRALHDALPIWQASELWVLSATASVGIIARTKRAGAMPTTSPASSRPRRTQATPMPETISRAEELTSELQSLMRNSYADFCSQKKNSKNRSGFNHYTSR